MMAFKKISVLLSILVLLLSIWYLFLKANDFEVVMNFKTAPGTVYQGILDWNRSLEEDSSIDSELIKKVPFQNISHAYSSEEFTLNFDWKIQKANDSITKVAIAINDLEHSISTRIKKILGTSVIEKLLHQEFSGFNEEMVKQIQEFKITVDGEQESPEAYVAYVNIYCNQNEKANKMISYSPFVNSFLIDNNIKLQANPFVEIVDWDINTQKIEYNFCFPITSQNNFPNHKEIKYKKVAAKKSLKASFWGNYSFSDNAWYALHQYTKDNNLKSLKTITEVFYNNPHTDVKDTTWEAAIYMEIE